MINGSILFTDQEMILAGNEMDVHAWDFVVYQKLLLPILRAFTQCTHLLHALSGTVVCRQVICGNKSWRLKLLNFHVDISMGFL
jgi:hypothetical protein